MSNQLSTLTPTPTPISPSSDPFSPQSLASFSGFTFEIYVAHKLSTSSQSSPFRTSQSGRAAKFPNPTKADMATIGSQSTQWKNSLDTMSHLHSLATSGAATLAQRNIYRELISKIDHLSTLAAEYINSQIEPKLTAALQSHLDNLSRSQKLAALTLGTGSTSPIGDLNLGNITLELKFYADTVVTYFTGASDTLFGEKDFESFLRSHPGRLWNIQSSDGKRLPDVKWASLVTSIGIADYLESITTRYTPHNLFQTIIRKTPTFTPTTFNKHAIIGIHGRANKYVVDIDLDALSAELLRDAANLKTKLSDDRHSLRILAYNKNMVGLEYLSATSKEKMLEQLAADRAVKSPSVRSTLYAAQIDTERRYCSQE